MSETKAPVEVAAEALANGRHEAKKQGMDVWPLTDVARAAFASVDVEGLAAEIGRHWLLEPSRAYGGGKRVERSCNCGRKLTPQYFEWRHSQEMTQHEAEVVKAWLGGGA